MAGKGSTCNKGEINDRKRVHYGKKRQGGYAGVTAEDKLKLVRQSTAGVMQRVG